MLLAKQSSRLTAFRMKIYEAGEEIGFVDWSSFPTAKNSRLRHLIPKDISQPTISIRGEEYQIEFEYTRTGWNNDTRLILKSKNSEIVSAQVKQSGKWFCRPTIEIPSLSAQLLRRNSLFRIRYHLTNAAGIVGTIEEPTCFSWSREFQLRFDPNLPQAVQLFLLFITVNSAIG